MTGTLTAYRAARLFDGRRMHDDAALLVRDGRVEAIAGAQNVPGQAQCVDLDGTLAPGFVDLQVNGGDGGMFNDAPDAATLHRIAAAHGRLGATAILPTLITDTPEVTRAAIDATEAAIAAGVPGIAGLHLEGPHLSQARKGAHDPALIRPMTAQDLDRLVAAAARLPVLMVTLAPESATPEQIATLAAAGVVVSLGHTDCGFDAAVQAAQAGARCVTHLFNAMSQLGSREPGLVGAALGLGVLSAGLIADLVHVHPATIRTALAAKTGPGRVFLVSDAMATAGSDIDRFELNGRTILRRDGRLTLADGTLAGADLELSTAIANLTGIGVPLATALEMATAMPARLIGQSDRLGHLAPGRAADFVHLDAHGALSGVWRGGARIGSAVI